MTEEQLPLHKMSNEEIHEMSVELFEAVLEVRKKRIDFSEVKKEWSEDIKALEQKILEVSRILKEQEAARSSDA